MSDEPPPERLTEPRTEPPTELPTERTPEHRLYADLAPWWPLISPPEEYVDEILRLRRALARADGEVRTLLELGSGGGHVASHLADLQRTLVDIAEPMLAQSRLLNPTAEHIVADMRTIRLERTFDAVLIHDAVDYHVTADDITAALTTARAHLRPGGVVVLAPDHLAETFAPRTDCGGVDAPDGRGARFMGWSWDPDAGDTTIRTEYAFMLREADGTTRVVHETHVTGLFPRQVWRDLLVGAGFTEVDIDEGELPGWGPHVLISARVPLTTP